MGQLYKNHFYHNLIRKYVTVMGALVDGIDLVRYNPDGSENSRVRIPVTYAPKEKWVRRTTEDPSLDRQPAVTLPRISYEMTGMMYDPDRKVSGRRAFIFTKQETGNKVFKVYTPVPYLITFNVYCWTKTQDETFQVIEQIAPFFQPDMVVEMRAINSPDVKFDVPIALDAFQTTDNYDGDLTERREIITTFEFIMRGYLFGPIRASGVIKHVDLTMYEYGELDKAPNLRSYLVDMDIEPFIDGVPLEDIKSTDDYGYQVNVQE